MVDEKVDSPNMLKNTQILHGKVHYKNVSMEYEQMLEEKVDSKQPVL